MLGAGGAVASAAPSTLPSDGRCGTLTIHLFSARNYENLKEGTGTSADAASISEQARAVAGVSFTVERLLVAEDSTPSLTSPADPTVGIVRGVTDADGIWQVGELARGCYRITQEVPAGSRALEKQFLIAIPTKIAVAGGGQWLWDVHVFPKNTHADAPPTDPKPKPPVEQPKAPTQPSAAPQTGEMLLLEMAVLLLVLLFGTLIMMVAERRRTRFER